MAAADRRTLETVAERFIIELDRAVVGLHRATVAVPVVDEAVELAQGWTFGGDSGAGSGASANPALVAPLQRR